MTKKTIILWVICLVVADQVIKIIILNYFIDIKFDIIDSVFGFHPIFNNKYSYANSLFGLNLGLLPHVIVLILVQFLVVFFYSYYKTIQCASTLIDISFIFGQSAVICVLCGFFLWKDGIMDFIFLHPFTFDFKDIYLNSYVIFFLWNYFKNYKEIKSTKLNLKEYLKRNISNIKCQTKNNNK